MQQKKTFLQRLLSRDDAEIQKLRTELKQVQDKVEDELTQQLRVLDKGLDGDYYSTGSKADFTSIEEDITKAQLQKLLTTETWFFIVVNTIAKTIAALPPKVEKQVKVKKKVLNDVGQWEEVEQEKYVDASGSPELDLFQKPNSIQTPVEFYWLLLMDLLGTGDAYLYIDAEGLDVGPNNSESRLREVLNNLRKGVPKGLYRLNPALIEIIPSKDGKMIEAYGFQSDQGYFKFAPNEILHIKLPNPVSAFYGMAPIIAAMKNVLIDRYTKEHFIRFYKQGARLGGVIKTQQKLTKEQLTRLERTFESNYTGRQNHHRTLVLPQGMEYQTIEANPGETSLIEFTKANKEPILAVYDVPPVKVGILDGASYANANVQLKIYYTDTIMPILKIVEEAINTCPKIMNPMRKMRFKFDLSGVEALREDQLAATNIAKGMIDSGATVNEVRFKVFGLGPIPGGDKSKIVESMKDQNQWVPFMGRSARRGDEKAPGSTQPDNAALADIEPTTGTFSERVAQLTSAAVNMGIPFEQALWEAIEQALKEGFIPTAEELAQGGAPQPEDDKKKEPEEQPESELIAGKFSKEMILEHWKATAGDGIQPIFDKRAQEVDLFFKRLMQLWLRPVKKLRSLNAEGKAYKIKAEDDITPSNDDVEAFISREARKASASMEEAMKIGYESIGMKIPMGFPDELAKKKLLEISTRNVKSVVGTTRDQLKTVLDDAYSRGAGMNEIEGDIRAKFDEISEGRAKTIVRTEVLTAVSAGQRLKVDEFKKEFPKESKKLKKMWISAQDEKVRDHHAEYDAFGPVEDDYEYAPGLKYPRDVDCKDAGEVINCRCTEIYFMEDDENIAIDLMSNTDLLPNEGNNYLEGEEKDAEEPKGGTGSGGARPGAGRPRGSGRDGAGAGDTPKPSGSGSADHRVSKESNGQIRVGKPRSVGEAQAQLAELGRIFDAERARVDRDPSAQNQMRLQHARSQLQRGMTNARQIIDQAKR